MKFLMQPIRRSLSRSTVLEEVNDSDMPMEPLHYAVATPVVEQQLASMQAVSVNGQICGTGVGRCRKGRFTAGIRTVDWPDEPKKLLDGPEGSLWLTIWTKVPFMDLTAIGTAASFWPWVAEEPPVELVSADAPICEEQAGVDGRRESLPQLPELSTGKMNPQALGWSNRCVPKANCLAFWKLLD